MSFYIAARQRGAWKHVACFVLGHRFFWLDVDHQCHCIRCGRRDDAYFDLQERLASIRRAGRRATPQAPRPSP